MALGLMNLQHSAMLPSVTVHRSHDLHKLLAASLLEAVAVFVPFVAKHGCHRI